MYNFIKVKLYRLKTSNNYLKLIKLYHFFFGETFKKKIRTPDFYNNKIHRIDVVNKIIDFRTKENLNVFVGAFDNGIGLIYKKKNLNKLILDKEIKKIKYKDYYHNHHDYLNLISYETFFKKIDDFK